MTQTKRQCRQNDAKGRIRESGRGREEEREKKDSEMDEGASLMFARINAHSVTYPNSCTHTHTLAITKEMNHPMSLLPFDDSTPHTWRLYLEHAKSTVSSSLLFSSALHVTEEGAGGGQEGETERETETQKEED